MFLIFEPYPDLLAAISERKDGTMKVFNNIAKDAPVLLNREHFFLSLGIDPVAVATADLVHGNQVAVVKSSDRGLLINGVDGLVTNVHKVFLSVTVADCVPVYLYDPKNRVVGIIHAGWRGLANEILPHTISTIQKAFGSKPNDMLAGIGPCICQSHYQVGSDMKRSFALILPQYILKQVMFEQKEGKILLDLKTIAKQQLLGVGLQERNIEVSQECTFELSDKYFSYRRDKSDPVEAMVAVIGIKN